VAMPYSKMKEAIAEVMKNEGYIENYEVLSQSKFPTLVIRLRYVGGRRDRRSVITGLQRVSSPGRRIYVGKKEIPWVLSGLGVGILTTSRGIMTDQKARQMGLGGELICKVW
jgi:small subunit ribosomal protein S8